MTLSINAEDINGESKIYQYDKNPDTCPLCNLNMNAKRLTANFSKWSSDRQRLEIIYRCTNSKCDSFFVSTCFRDLFGPYASSIFYLKFQRPKNNAKKSFGDKIENLSPSFVEIYNQALSAESSGLNQISGIGFRKALEFLIKDFAISQNPGDEDSIKESFLGKVISKYINDSRLKITAERATWLGNDEAHYVRRWEDRDINDLKLLIKLSVNWVENVLLTDEYATDMNS